VGVAIVLAGGRGSRLGGAKPAAPLAGRPLIEHVLDAVRAGGLEPVVLAKPGTALPPLACRVVLEPPRPLHPLCGILAGLRAIDEPGAVVCPTDMPFLEGALLAWLAARPEPLVVVRFGGRTHPLLGRYARALEPALAALLRAEPAMRDVVRELGARVVEEDELRRFGDPARMLADLNTPAALARAGAPRDQPSRLNGMVVRIRLFAQLRERAGAEWIDAELAPGATVADALRELGARPPLGELLARLPVRMAVNREIATDATALHPDDELALLPPVSGGGAPHVRVREEPLDPASVTDRVRGPAAGAVVTFEGTTRDVEHLDYEAYREMAEERMAAIVERAVERHSLEAAAAEHRVGRVALGEPAVVVAASAAHRAEAFAGAREIIDAIKAQAPIWKRELDGGEARWVAGEAVEP